MNDDIFKKIAANNHVSVEEVKEEINKSIREACKNPDAPINKIGAGPIPTAEEVIEYALKEIAKSNMN
jgi:hypothetical protein